MSIETYVSNLRKSYAYLKDMLSPAEQRGNMIKRLLFLGILSDQDKQALEKALDSQEFLGVNMIYQAGIESLKYKREQLKQMINQGEGDTDKLSKTYREVEQLLEDAQEDYKHKQSIVDDIRLKTKLV